MSGGGEGELGAPLHRPRVASSNYSRKSPWLARAGAPLPPDGSRASQVARAAVQPAHGAGVRLLDPAIHRRQRPASSLGPRRGGRRAIPVRVGVARAGCGVDTEPGAGCADLSVCPRHRTPSRAGRGSRSRVAAASAPRRPRPRRDSRHPVASRRAVSPLRLADVWQRTSSERVPSSAGEGCRSGAPRGRRARGKGGQGPAHSLVARTGSDRTAAPSTSWRRPRMDHPRRTCAGTSSPTS